MSLNNRFRNLFCFNLQQFPSPLGRVHAWWRQIDAPCSCIHLKRSSFIFITSTKHCIVIWHISLMWYVPEMCGVQSWSRQSHCHDRHRYQRHKGVSWFIWSSHFQIRLYRCNYSIMLERTFKVTRSVVTVCTFLKALMPWSVSQLLSVCFQAILCASHWLLVPPGCHDLFLLIADL